MIAMHVPNSCTRGGWVKVPALPLIVVSREGPKTTNANKGGGKGGGNLRAMNEVKPKIGVPPLFSIKPVNDKGGACHAPDCDHRSGCMLQLKRQQHTKDERSVR